MTYGETAANLPLHASRSIGAGDASNIGRGYGAPDQPVCFGSTWRSRPLQDAPQSTLGRKPQMPETPTFGRYAEIPYDEMTPEQQEGYRFLVEVRGAAGGPSKIWVHNPKRVKGSAPLGAHFHPGGYSLSGRDREIAVILINSKWHSSYPTAAHERRGKEVGLPAEKVEAMLAGLSTSFSD